LVSDNYTTITAIVTAYAPFDNQSGMCNDGNPNSTATGTKPGPGTLAADPERLPYGTQIYIPGYGLGTVEDTGGALRNDKENIRIDIFVDTYEEAIEWGRQELVVEIRR
jgi:3D (Asp-Asp-Asp) domain-containing protein